MTRTLADWLAHIDSLNPRSIDLGLQRVRQVGEALDVLRPAPASVIVAGTNGKGSTAVCLEQILLAGNRRVGCTLSPHLLAFNERIRLNGQEAEDALLCDAFAAVEAARDGLPLTYFEFSCLAALHCFKTAGVDVAVMEVGLGGRLDAFNSVDADVAVITSIGLDHVEYLGATRAAIGREKAGVFRPGQRIVLGADLPAGVLDAAARCTPAPLRWGREIRLAPEDAGSWRIEVAGRAFADLARGALPLDNGALAAAAAVAVDQVLGEARTDAGAVRQGLLSAWLPARLESIAAGGRRWLVDVAHNALGARFLRREVAQRAPGGGLIALFGNLVDKDSNGMFRALEGLVRQWVLVDAPGLRGLSAKQLAARGAPPNSRVVGGLGEGVLLAGSLARASDVILAFGSFAVAAGVRQKLLNADA